MKQTINRISNRVGDWFATLFTIAALLLVPHAIIRPIIGYGLHHPRPWNEMATEDKEPWRRVAKDAIRTFFGSPEFQNLLDDVYDEGYDGAEKDAKGKNEGVQ